ncbi:hypothetical protein OVY29_16705 [Sphingopyxis sp. SE2]|uniref:hypothetical protein n=1 Tax=Sphingopyxis sp. SE2 TaxID=1586240 RepID=UPI0028C14B31|nr:hypothetical protein [Sphingopyxis sp. SE2]MDT7530302.1 hypothetical protein [Sphingopyxis sp. SE2]
MADPHQLAAQHRLNARDHRRGADGRRPLQNGRRLGKIEEYFASTLTPATPFHLPV